MNYYIYCFTQYLFFSVLVFFSVSCENNTNPNVFFEETPIKNTSTESNKPQVNILFFSDFTCHKCFQAEQMLAELQQEFGLESLKIEKLAFPQSHNTFLATQADLCAKKQDKYNLYHEALFTMNETYTLTYLLKLSDDLKMNTNEFRVCLSSGITKSEVISSKNIAKKWGVTQIPFFLIDHNIEMRDIKPKEFFRKLINQLLEEKQS